MSKSTKKSQSYNEDILNVLEKKYGVTKMFIRASIKGDRKSTTSDSIKRDYKKMLSISRNAIKKQMQES